MCFVVTFCARCMYKKKCTCTNVCTFVKLLLLLENVHTFKSMLNSVYINDMNIMVICTIHVHVY